MALELAKLVIEVDSSSLSEASKALDSFAEKAEKVDSVVKNIRSFDSVSKKAGTVKKATKSLTEQVVQTASAFNVLNDQTNKSLVSASGVSRAFNKVVSQLSNTGKNIQNLTNKIDGQVISLTDYKTVIDGVRASLSKMNTGLQSKELSGLLYGTQTGKIPVDIISSIKTPGYDDVANRKAMSRFYVGNIAAQFQDIGVTAAMGMNPLTIALQQGTQLSEILKSMEKPLVGLSAAFKSLISPISLMTIGLVALVSAGIQLVDWTGVMVSTAGSLSNGLQWLADNLTGVTVALSVTAAGFIATTSGAAIFSGGLLTLTGVFLKFTTAVVASTAALLSSPVFWGATAVLAVAAAVGALAQKFGLLDGVLKPVKDFIQGWANDLKGVAERTEELKEKWLKIEDYVENAIEKSKLEASVLGKTNDEALLMKNTFDILNKAKQEGLDVEKDSLYYIKAINRARSLTQVQLATEEAKAAHERLESYNELNKELFEQVFALKQETEWLSLSNAELDRMKNQYEILTNARKKLGDLTEQETAGFKAYADEITKAQKNLEFTKTINGFKEQENAIKSNKQSLLLYGQQAAIAKAKMDALAEASGKGFSQEQTDAIIVQAEKIGQLQYEYEKTESAIRFAENTTSGFFKDMRNGLAEGENAWKVFGDAVINVINSISDALIDMMSQYMVRGIVSSFVGASSAGIPSGNTLGTGLSQPTGTLDMFGPTSSGFFANGAVFNHGISKFAKGGTFTNGIYDSPTFFKFAKGSRFGLMGEAGPEAVMPLKRGPDGSLGVQVNGNSAGNNGNVIVNVINNSNASARTEEKQTSNGRQIDVIIDQIVSQKITDMGSATNKALSIENKSKTLISR